MEKCNSPILTYLSSAVIPYRPYLIVIPKFALEDHVAGGLDRAFMAFKSWGISEDEYLFAIAVENATEVRICTEELIRLGLSFDDVEERSDQFVVVAKEGIWWEVEWLVRNDGGSWFIADIEAPV